MSSTLRAGAASRDVSPPLGVHLCGQMHHRIAEGIRDPLEVNACYLANEDDELLILSLDHLGFYANSWEAEIRARICDATGVPSRALTLACTHTHTGPDIFGLLEGAEVNQDYLKQLEQALIGAAEQAVNDAQPARLGWGTGQAHIGFNRRMCWADGTHTMYGGAAREDYTGLEGPDDPTHSVLFARDTEDEQLIFVLHNNCCHSTCVEAATYASADFPGEARRLLRDTFGTALPVLYLQGASGDVAPWPMEQRSAREREQRLREVGALLYGETCRLMRLNPTVDAACIGSQRRELEMTIRLPSAEQLAQAREWRDQGEAEAPSGKYQLSVRGVLRLQEAFSESPTEQLVIQSGRVGDFAFTTNPCELYCQFGLDIRRRSPAATTAIVQLANGFNGYCPTLSAIHGGGYSADPTYWTRLEATAGARIVDEASRQLRRLMA